MIKLILPMLLCVLLFILLCNPVLTMKPFSLNLPNIKFAIGIFLIIFGIIFIQVNSELKGFSDGIDEAIKILKEHTKK